MTPASARILCAALAALLLAGCAPSQPDAAVPADLPAWVGEAGATRYPEATRSFCVDDYGARGDAVTDCTAAIQAALDACAGAGGGRVTFRAGIYLSGSLFVGSNTDLHIPRGTTLIGSQRIGDYRRIPTRVAGIETVWPAALVNLIGVENSAVSGCGTINGRGKPFWDKYWAMRSDYDPRGLRWVVDYDCERPRGILVADAREVTVRDIVLYQAGFWSLHILYSDHVTVDNIIISNNIEGRGPSTDGVDIDSSHHILVQNSDINCNDDNFCLKAGRDSDGLRVGRPCEYVVIRHCTAGHGDGLFTCGSETSGSIRHIAAYGLRAEGTKYGLRFKSTCQRGGTIEDIYLCDIEMKGVRNPLIVDMNWHPAYSTSHLPPEYEGRELPEHWRKLLTEVPPEQGTPKFRAIHLRDVVATDAAVCVEAGGIERSTLDGFTFERVRFEGQRAGSIRWARDWTFDAFEIKAGEGAAPALEACNFEIN